MGTAHRRRLGGAPTIVSVDTDEVAGGSRPGARMTDLAGRSVTVRVPATSANLGPGFDTLGLALALYDELTVTATTEPGVHVEVIGVGAGEVPTDETNLVVRSIKHTFDHYGLPMPGLALEAHNVIPHGRGLGSSGAAIVSGIMAAKGLLEGIVATRTSMPCSRSRPSSRATPTMSRPHSSAA